MLVLAPHDSIELNLPVPPIDAAPGVEYFLRVEFRSREEKPFLPAGWLAAWEQFRLRAYRPPVPAKVAEMPPLEVIESSDRVTVAGSGFSVGIDRSTGLLSFFEIEGRELLVSPLEPDFWRAPTDNDYGSRMPSRQGVWKDAGRIRTLDGLEVKSVGPGEVRIDVTLGLPVVNAWLYLSYEVFGSGDVIVTSRFVPPDAQAHEGLPDIPRIGLRFALSPDFADVAWYGRGPHENYSDRKTSSPVGLYAASVDQLYYPYIRPQENGNRTEARWVAFRDSAGVGLAAHGMPTLDWSALRFLQEDLDEGPAKHGRHTYDLRPRDLVAVHLDHGQMGVGGDNSWGAQPLERYRLPVREYAHSFRLSPVGPERDDPMEQGKRSLPIAAAKTERTP
jgi:beta-galactosidase